MARARSVRERANVLMPTVSLYLPENASGARRLDTISKIAGPKPLELPRCLRLKGMFALSKMTSQTTAGIKATKLAILS